MKKTGAWLVRYALEQLGVKYTFGIPGVHNTEIYDELNNSASITPVLVTHEGCGAFMADAISRTTDSIGTLVIVPAAGATHAASGIGEAFLDGIPMLVISGGVRSDSQFAYQLHDIDQHAFMRALTKKTYKIESHREIVSTLFDAYLDATRGEPGPVFVEVPVDIQLYSGEVHDLLQFESYRQASTTPVVAAQIQVAAELLAKAKRPGLFLGWGAVDASALTLQIAELLGAPVATTLQGLSSFPGNHPLHAGMGFGPAAVPAATHAFKQCDCLLAVGTRFGEIATGSFGVTVPENLIHVDINAHVFNANYPAKVAIEGDARAVLSPLLAQLQSLRLNGESRRQAVAEQVKADKARYLEEWFQHDTQGKVNPARFFSELRSQLSDDAFIVVDDGNHTFLTAELMPIHQPRHMISPTDFNCMGYAVPATIATKMANPDKAVVGIIGDGAFLMTCMEITTAAAHGIGAIFAVFNDGELAQISQAQSVPYNRKTCTVLGNTQLSGVALATGARYLRMESDQTIGATLKEAFEIAQQKVPVILDIAIDYSKKTRFTKGIVGTNLKRLPMKEAIRIVGRALARKVTG